MIAIITFLVGLFIGWFWTGRHEASLEKKKEQKKFREEIDLRATPDEHLSEVEILKKRYLVARMKEMHETLSRPLRDPSNVFHGGYKQSPRS